MVTNVLKLVHGWQNDGQEKKNFYEDSNKTLCPAGYDKLESRMHFIQCTAKHLQYGRVKWREEFKQPHGKLKSAKFIYEGFMCIFISLRCGDSPPSNITYIDSAIDKMVQKAWLDQLEIGWDQFLKGRVSKYWGVAQGLFYQNFPDTKGKVCFYSKLWATVRSLLIYSLHLWNDRCDSMHEVDEEDTKRIKHEKVVKSVGYL